MAKQETELVILEAQISPIVKKAQAIVVKDETSMKVAVAMLSELNSRNDQITEEKEKVTKPLNEALKAERGRWKPIETNLEMAIGALRKTIGAYQTAETARVKEEQSKIALRVGEGKGKIKIETAVARIEDIEQPEAKIVTESGIVKFRTDKKFEIMDVVLLSEVEGGKYVLPNEVLIRSAMKAGIEVAGVRYYEEQTVINSR